MSDPQTTPYRAAREERVDDMICDLLVALSRKSVKADTRVERRLIETYTREIIAYCDSTQPLEVTVSGPVTLT